jgi:Xaa-Pro aminopeptidase
VRIEDMVVVREDGIEVLTGAAKVPVIQVDGRPPALAG